MTRRTINLREDVLHLPSTPLEVDEAAGIVRGVKVLGLESRNGRRYLSEAVKAAVPKYEGARVNIDHPTAEGESRPYGSRFGRLRSARQDPDGCLRADLHYNPEHAHARSFAWWAKNDPQAVGLSHNAVGEVEEAEDGTLVVREILEVHSVDLVADPATTNGLRESAMDPLAALDDMGMGGGAEEPKPGDEHYAEHIGKAVVAILGDEAMDPEEKKKKILHLLKLDEVGTEQPPVEGETDLEEEDDEEEEEVPGKKKDGESMESLRRTNRQLQARLDAYELVERRGKARKKCQCLGLAESECSDVFIDGILAASSKDQIVRLIEDRKAILGKASTPRSSGPDHNPAAPKGKAPVAQPADKVAAALNGSAV